MLLGSPTKHGAGITLAGDYADLVNLYETIHYFAGENGPISLQHDEFVLGLAYDIRHAYQGDRRTTLLKTSKTKYTYFAVDILWPIFLVQIAMLRSAASYLPTSKTQQANLYRIESCTENALNDLDTNVSRVLPVASGILRISCEILIGFISIKPIATSSLRPLLEGAFACYPRS